MPNYQNPKYAPPEERIWRYINVPSEPGGCWLWTGSRGSVRRAHHVPYGYFNMKVEGRASRSVAAHRAMFMLFVRDIPEGVEVCHTCDNPLCVNLAHLFLGTHKENVRDCISKGRGNRAEHERSPRAKLTSEQVIKLRSRRTEGATYSVLTREFGLSKSTVGSIVTGKSWKGLA